MNKNIKKLKQRLSLRIFTRFFIAIFIYTIFIIVTFLVARYICSRAIWYYDDFLYPLLSFINRNYKIFLALVMGFGYLIIFLYYWMKTMGYLEVIIEATEMVNSSTEDLITLPTELKEVEYQFNQIKMTTQKNERLAKEAEQRKNDLVVYLAHDLKTPLTSVIGYLSLLRDEQEISQELREKYLSITLEKAERLEDLINEFFEITRFNLSNLSLEVSKINLSRMLEQIIFEFNPLFAEKELECIAELPPDLMIRCDVNKMLRVFDNILRNAINYSYHGGKVKVILKKKETGIELSITNQGNTIPPEKLERIFEQFYRLDTARSSKSGGAGLGLAIAKEIVELHGGKIIARSENEIVEFIISLPEIL